MNKRLMLLAGLLQGRFVRAWWFKYWRWRLINPAGKHALEETPELNCSPEFDGQSGQKGDKSLNS